MTKISLAIGAAALLTLGALAGTAQAGERGGVHAQLTIQAPVLLAHYDNPRPVHGVRVTPAYPVQGYYGRRDGYRDDGRWDQRRGRHDRDHDGVPNRFDRDRDGDGVPNRFDRQPNNPYRY